MKRLKVCHFASVHPTTDTRVFHRECTSLAKHFDVTLIAIGNNSGTINNVNIIAVPKPKTRIHRLLYTTWNVFFKAWKQNADIYHIHDAELIPFALLLWLRGKKIIYDVHENTYEDIRHKPWIPEALRWILGTCYRVLERMAAASMHTILVIARPEFAKRFITGKYTIIQNFADYDQFTPYRNTNRTALEGNHLFYMGTVYDYYYDFIPVINAIDLLRQKGIIIQFHCVGYTGTYVKKFLSKIPAYEKIKDQLHFYGYLSTEEGYEISKKCKIGLCLKNQPEEILVSHERKFFEYLAIGLPLISCRSHIYKDIIDRYAIGKYTDLSNAQCVADTLAALMIDPSLNQMAENAVRIAAEEYNWNTEEARLIDLYKKLSQ